MDRGYVTDPLPHLVLTPSIVRRVASVDEFKGRWEALAGLAPDRFSSLRLRLLGRGRGIWYEVG